LIRRQRLKYPLTSDSHSMHYPIGHKLVEARMAPGIAATAFGMIKSRPRGVGDSCCLMAAGASHGCDVSHSQSRRNPEGVGGVARVGATHSPHRRMRWQAFSLRHAGAGFSMATGFFYGSTSGVADGNRLSRW
jgi:hypothetical protein